MAEARILWAEDEFSCPICLELLKNPVAIPCGHSYCMSCITVYWDQDDQKRVYSCPQCRQTFTPRPVLGKNTMLAEVVEKLKTELQAACSAQCYSGPGDVECDVCTGRKCKAVKSCLVCLNSYCQNHLEQHENLFKSKRHNLMDATRRLQEMICPQHNKLLEVYCRSDQQCICCHCMMDEHKNHETVSAAEERTEKQQIQLEATQKSNQQTIQQREKELQVLREFLEFHKRSAQSAVKDSERIFTEMIRSIERSRSEVTQLIRDQEKAAVSPAEGDLERLEQEIADLKRRDAELEQLSHTEDHIHFLKSFQSLHVFGSSHSFRLALNSSTSFDDVGKCVSRLKEKLEHFCKAEIQKISERVSHIKIIPTIVPQIRQKFLQYSCKLTLDKNTVNKNLRLSEGNKVITSTDRVQPYPDHPDRFDGCVQVLCRESVSGRCYWEVEWSGWVDISVSYKSINRKGQGVECRFGSNDQSWSLYCSESRCSFWHNNIETELPVVSRSSRIGVYVDHSAGILSFYSISDTMTLIHRVHTTFTQPLHRGFWVDEGSVVKLCDLSQ